MSTLLPAPATRSARSLARSVLDRLAGPHGLDRYLELVDPLLVSGECRAVVTDVRHETPDVTTLTLRPNRWDGHRAGQYVQVTVEIDGRRATRCYSISSSAHRDDGQLTITVKADPDGRVSPFLVHRARPGLVVGLSQPEGEFVLPEPRPARLLLVSGGSGITPVMSMLRTLADEGAETDVTFLHYARTAADVAFADELRELHARRSNVTVATVLTRQRADGDPAATGRGLAGHLSGHLSGHLTGHLSSAHVDAVVGDPTDVPAFVCGPTGLIESATQLWDGAGLADLLHVERFTLGSAVATDDQATGTITLASSGRSIANDGRPLLDQAEDAGLSPQAGCRMGICHTCIRPKLAGQVRDVRDGRVSTCDPEDVQICISAPVGDVTVDL